MSTHTTQTVLEPSSIFLEGSARELIRISAALAGFCEHVEHNEPNSIGTAIDAAARLRSLATQIAAQVHVPLSDLYRSRVLAVEQASIHSRSVIPGVANLPGADALRDVTSWDQVQVAQLLHDRQFHPDVFGMSKLDQLRHYTFHVTKLAGLLVDAIDRNTWTDFRDRRLADIAIFGVKLATVCNETLPSDLVDK